jgi:putative transcriptional regulator
VSTPPADRPGTAPDPEPLGDSDDEWDEPVEPPPGVPAPGRLLVATPVIDEPTFSRTVVLLLDHDEDGSLGVVLNRPTEVDVDDVLPDWEPLVTGDAVVFDGGPVGRDSALGLAAVPGRESDEPLGFRRVTGAFGLVDLDAPPELLAAEVSGLRIFAGYAGWGAGQLDDELDDGAWFVVTAEHADAFCAEPEALWRAVLRRQGGEIAFVSTYPDDPADN